MFPSIEPDVQNHDDEEEDPEYNVLAEEEISKYNLKCKSFHSRLATEKKFQCIS